MCDPLNVEVGVSEKLLKGLVFVLLPSSITDELVKQDPGPGANQLSELGEDRLGRGVDVAVHAHQHDRKVVVFLYPRAEGLVEPTLVKSDVGRHVWEGTVDVSKGSANEVCPVFG
jgi:hypothetical protein